VHEWKKADKSELWTYKEEEIEYEQLECGHKYSSEKQEEQEGTFWICNSDESKKVE
jgi:hypothetical protein